MPGILVVPLCVVVAVFCLLTGRQETGWLIVFLTIAAVLLERIIREEEEDVRG